LVECGGSGGVPGGWKGRGARDFASHVGERGVGGGVHRVRAAGEMAGEASDCVGIYFRAGSDVRDAVWDRAAGARDEAARELALDGEFNLRTHNFLWHPSFAGRTRSKGLRKFSEGSRENRRRDLRWSLLDCA